MKIRSFALLAISVPICLSAASSEAQLAVYYSFDTPPSAALVTGMQAEVNRILSSAGVRVAWRAAESSRNGEDFQGVVFLRFQGECSWDESLAAKDNYSDPAGQSLAATDIADGHVLPFGSVHCDTLRHYLTPVLKSNAREDNEVALGRAIARVSSHEIYHMLTGSEEHARHGIASASHSRADLTGPSFGFGQQQTNWLRAWAAQTVSRQAIVAATVTNNPVPAEPVVSGGGDAAGR